MTQTQTTHTDHDALAPVVEDLSTFIVCGRVTTEDKPGHTHITSALTDAVEAERLGFRRVWLSERFDLKDAGAILAGVAARTTRLDVGTAALASSSRHPLVTASFGATMNGLYGPRTILGLGRGAGMPGMTVHKIADIVHYARTLKGLWAGGIVSWQPAGAAEAMDLRTVDALGDVPRPELWYCTYGGPKAAVACADEAFDGVMLYPFLTVEAVKTAVERMRNACADRGRDPDSLRICHPIVVANDLDDLTTRAYAHARLVTYLEWPGHGEILARANGWDEAVLARLRHHDALRAMPDMSADQSFHRIDLIEPSRVIPDEWVTDTAAIGSVERCVSQFHRYRDAGVDEIAIYGSRPSENANLIAAWRERSATREPVAAP
ncbi:MAG: hypothetical protein JWO02_568 [Solirubrobacterales bacterium]|nr:hypothetical protein [Solirubrobacterales bacterium]